MDGLFSNVLGSISRIINSKLNVTRIKSGGINWSEYDGLVDKLFKNETDIAVSNMIITKDRLKFVDFALPLSTTSLVLCIKENIKKRKLEYFKVSIQNFLSHMEWTLYYSTCVLNALSFINNNNSNHKFHFSDIQL